MPYFAPSVETAPSRTSEVLSPELRRIALALAEATIPAGAHVGRGDAGTVQRFEAELARATGSFASACRGALRFAEYWPVPFFGARLSGLDIERRKQALDRWANRSSKYERWMLRLATTPLKAAHFETSDSFEKLGACTGLANTPAASSEPWRRQASQGEHLADGSLVTTEVVVIGSGAGGAALASELARRGRAVLILEAGRFFERSDFKVVPSEAARTMYLNRGGIPAFGNAMPIVIAGQSVGGTTTINSGTSFRLPPWTLERWKARYGLTDFEATLDPYYRRVEELLGVAPAQAAHLGGPARIIARGASRLGLSHGPLPRNAPDCDGQGACWQGCPTGAKRSANVTYIPDALKHGAQLLYRASVERIITVGGRARGCEVRLAGGKNLHVRADAVVVAAGALHTPLLLERSGLCHSSGYLGRNLSIHPAVKALAVCDEIIDMSRGIPQSYGVDSLASEGIRFEGASTSPYLTALGIPWVGESFTRLMDDYQKLALFGFMLQDTSRGTVRAGRDGLPFLTYHQNQQDLDRIHRGLVLLCEMFFAGGARRVLPMIPGFQELQTASDLERLRAHRLRAGDIDLSGFHPLGTCRMGTDPKRSCIGPTQEAHDTAGLFVSDGSALPSSLGVNPQITLMALGLRTGALVDDRLSAFASRPISPPAERHLTFAERMTGEVQMREGRQGTYPFTFNVRARSLGLPDFARSGQLRLEGSLRSPPFGDDCPVEGLLQMTPPRGRELRYEFTFVSAPGDSFRFVGKKVISPRRPVHSMIHLEGVIFGPDDEVKGQAWVEFDLRRDLWSFMRSWTLAPASHLTAD